MASRRPISTYVLLAGLVFGAIAFGSWGFFNGLYDAQYSYSYSSWIDLRGIDPVVGLVFGVIGGGILGILFALILESAVRLPVKQVVATFSILACLTVFGSFAEYRARAGVSLGKYQSEMNAEHTQAAKAVSNYSTLGTHLSDLQYPGSRLYHSGPDDPYDFTTNDDADTVAAYYQRVLGVPVIRQGVIMGPAYETREAVTHYAGVPIHLVIGRNTENDGRKTDVTVSTTEDSAVAYWIATTGAKPSSGASTGASAHTILPPAPPKVSTAQNPASGSSPSSQAPSAAGPPGQTESMPTSSSPASSAHTILPPAPPPPPSAPSSSAPSAQGTASPPATQTASPAAQPAHP